MQTAQADLGTLLSDILNRLDALILAQNDNSNLWNAERCARFFSCSIGHFKSRIACKPDFPRPVKLNQTAHSLWIPADVKDYAKRKQSIK
ncbi:hypothetical protein BGI40_01690 [Snodgrassella communis]|uniref:hypothetical protein n=1 Tax=Snodgrassella TaxID=1193515 RepID=UPI00055F3287|nr:MULTISPECIES: hypothetical protein [Snodgrassella]PIT06843.1 hypothetical protein BGI29_10140 [Snodgrassella communis]PIT18246.1 hypothetical protein BGI33_01445 [Snodgrassella alvi]PIT30531.1 hypothetical protein BGI38_00710 [Snodgrassella communis]PIT30598.1 hypothetical protein BGI39_00100 [Snodgrassella communis]PIT34023.1 hypothetical protein BGI40_06340 [Snodgrassella communis]